MTHSLYQLPNDVRSEFSVDSNGKVWASARATARLAGVDKGKIIKPTYGLLARIKTSIGRKPLPEFLRPFAGFDYWVEHKIPYDLVIAILKYYYMIKKFTQSGLLLIGMPALEEKIKKKKHHKSTALPSTEKYYVNKLYKELGGKTEVITLAGRIDLLTSTQIIEVKGVTSWKSAIGQVLVYGHYYPSHEKRIHLFGETQQVFLDEVRKHTDKLNIVVTWNV